MRGGYLVIAGLLLAGCEAQSAAPARAPVSAPRLAAPWDGGPLKVGEHGVGPIGPATPFSADALAALFPDAEVKADDGSGSIPRITVEGAVPILRLEGGREPAVIAAVHVVGGPAVGPNGERLSSPFAKAGFTAGACVIDGADAVCRRTADSHIAFIYALPGGREAPTAERLAAEGFLREMVWTPAPV